MRGNVVVFLLLCAAGALALRLTPRRLGEEWKARRRPKKAAVGKELAQRKRRRITGKRGRAERLRDWTAFLLEASGTKLGPAGLAAVCLAFSALGALAGAAFHNGLLAAAMAVCFPFLPVQYLRLKSVSYRRFLNMQIEGALSAVTNAYLQTEDVLSAVEQNLGSVEEPLRGILRGFALDVRMGGNVQRAIGRMDRRVQNRHFSAWCDCLIRCQQDRGQKIGLAPIAEQLADLRQLQAKLDTAMMDIWRDHILVSLLAAGSIPLTKLLNAEWYAFLMDTGTGRFLVCLTFVVIFLATLYVMRVNKPVNMEG